MIGNCGKTINLTSGTLEKIPITGSSCQLTGHFCGVFIGSAVISNPASVVAADVHQCGQTVGSSVEAAGHLLSMSMAFAGGVR